MGDWLPIFNGIFNSNLPDEWDLTLENETKEQSEVKRKELWERMVDEECQDVRFQCPVRTRISIHIFTYNLLVI